MNFNEFMGLVMLVSMVIYVPVMSCFNMPWVSLGAEMTPDYHERTSVMAIRNAPSPAATASSSTKDSTANTLA